jgi:serine/threonine-protein kinase
MRPWGVKGRGRAPDPEFGRAPAPQAPAPARAAPTERIQDDAGLRDRPEPVVQMPAPDPQVPEEKKEPEGAPALQYSDLPSGTTLLNRYRVVRKIGGGGFGYVYLVEDTSVGEELVLKILNPQISMDDTMTRRFVQELKYTRRITHKNVIRLHDFLEMGGTHAISMEYFPGDSLAKVLRGEGGVEWTRGVRLAEQICEGLHAAHAQGIIHRDIKPPNILVGDDDTVKIVDFGLASMAQYSGSRLTKSGILIGTPYYMAPEQITGAEVGVHSDIYSLGALFFEMFTGKPPYEGETAVNILFQHLKSDIPRLRSVNPEIPEALDRLVAQAMSKSPLDRPQSVQAIWDRLTALPKS